MSVRTVALGAGGSALLHGGNVVRLHAASDPVTVELLRDGQRVEKCENVTQGWFWEPFDLRRVPQFDAVRVTSATEQSVTLECAMGLVRKRPPPNPMLQGLLAYWDLAEASGDRADDAGNGNTLTDFNTVGSGAGVGAGQTAAAFTAANFENLKRGFDGFADDGSFEYCGWFLQSTAGPGNRAALGVWGGAQQHHLIFCNGANFRFIVGNNAGTTAQCEIGGVALAGAWVFFSAAYDADADEVSLDLNNTGTRTTAALAGPLETITSAPLQFGSWQSQGYLDGRMQAVGRWNRVLTVDERATLYNGGSAAVLYADL